jgi:serine/threonine protein kinase
MDPCDPRRPGIVTIIGGVGLEVSFIHSHSVVHRDLKLVNIVIDYREWAKLGDLESIRLLQLDATQPPHVHQPAAADWLILCEFLVGKCVFLPTTGQAGLMRDIKPRGPGPRGHCGPC